MNTVLEIESAISRLPEDEFWKLSTWFDEMRDKAWTEKMQEDAESGRLDFLFEEAALSRRGGEKQEWPAKS